MNITTEDLGNRQVVLTIEVDEKRVDEALRGATRQIARNYNIPGFRRGRAPYHVILQRFGREALLQEALEELAQDVVKDALEAEDLEPYNAGSLEDVQLEPLVLTLRLPLRPTVDLGDYRELRVDPPSVEVDETRIDAELARLRQANAILEPAGDRAASSGDWMLIDVRADLDGQTLVREEEYEFVLDEDDGFAPGFSQQILGMSAGDEKQFSLELGDNWGEDNSGREAHFTATVREVRSRTLPDMDDDLARTVGDFDTIDELSQSIRERFEQEAQREADSQYSDTVLDALVEQATIEYPPDIVDDRVDRMAEDLEQRLAAQGVALDDYFKLTGQLEDQFRDSLRPQAEIFVQRGLALGELAEQEQVGVEGEELDERIALMSSSWGETAGTVRETLYETENVRSIASALVTDKAMQRLVEIAKGEASPLDEAVDGEALDRSEENDTDAPAGERPGETGDAESASDDVGADEGADLPSDRQGDELEGADKADGPDEVDDMVPLEAGAVPAASGEMADGAEVSVK